MRDTDILAIEIVAIEVAASSHTLFCCRIRRASEHSGGLFKQSSLVYLLQSIHIQTNSSPNHSFIYLFILWNEKEGYFILLPDHWKKTIFAMQ